MIEGREGVRVVQDGSWTYIVSEGREGFSISIKMSSERYKAIGSEGLAEIMYKLNYSRSNLQIISEFYEKDLWTPMKERMQAWMKEDKATRKAQKKTATGARM